MTGIPDSQNNNDSHHKSCKSDTGVADKLIEWVVESTLPSIDMSNALRRTNYQKSKPPISINTTTRNFTKLASRAGLIFETVYLFDEIYNWEHPSFTLSILCIYSYMCLYPVLIPIVPLLGLAFGLMVPAYMTRHPPDTHLLDSSNVPSKGPPLRPADIKTNPVPEVSREFYLNVVDIQNSMADYVVFYDKLHLVLSKTAYFADENVSCLVLLILIGLSVFIWTIFPIISQIISPRIQFVLLGWLVFGLQHPRISCSTPIAVLKSWSTVYGLTPKGLWTRLNSVADSQFGANNDPLNNELPRHLFEAFEVQSYDIHTSCWTDSLYQTLPYEIPGVLGVPSLQEICPPKDWKFLTKWDRDYNCEKWAEQRFTTSLDTDESKWVYDFESTRRIRRWICWGVPIINE